MDKKLFIDPSKLNQYVVRELGWRIWLVILPYLLISVPTIILDKYEEFSVVTLVFVGFVALLFIIKRGYAKSIYFQITPKSIEFNLDLDKVNLFMALFITFLLSRNKARHGSTEKAIIDFNIIKSLNFKTKEIIIIANNNSVLTNNDKIRILREVEGFEEVRAVFERLNSDA